MELILRLLRWSFLLPLLVIVAGNEENYLYSGCEATFSVNDILSDSMSILVLYPPKDNQFELTVKQDGKEQTLTNHDQEVDTAKPRWTTMELDLKGEAKLRFQNGTTWLSAGEGSAPLNPIPGKKVTLSMSYGGFLPNCPQELPHFKLQKDALAVEVMINDGDEEIFSITASNKTKLSFKIGTSEWVLCWYENAKGPTVVKVPGPSDCTGLPYLKMLWLKIVYRESMIEISDPSDPSKLLTRFHEKMQDKGKITFQGVHNGVAYIVHHLKGFPQKPQEAMQYQPNHHASSFGPTEMFTVIGIVGGIFAFLIIVILCLLTTLFYNRWIQARQILSLLQIQNPKGDPLNKNLKLDYGRRPSLPSHPAPGIKIDTENPYLLPREPKNLDLADERPQSEHIYEDMISLGWPKRDEDKAPDTRVNQAFMKTSNLYEVPKKHA